MKRNIPQINKQQMATAIAKNLGLSYTVAEATINCLLDEIVAQFHDGKSIEFRNFGTFSPYYKKARTYKVARTKEDRSMPGRTTLKFKPSKQIIVFGN